MPVNQHLAIFESYRGENFSGNPKYIFKELSARAPSFQAVISAVDLKMINPSYKCTRVRRMSLRYYYYLARAKYTVNDVNYPDFVTKRPGTIHIQTMHGTPLKLMGSDIIKVEEKAYSIDLLGLFVRSKRWDVLVCPNQYTAEIFQRVFRYRGKILESGYPRNDIFAQKKDDSAFQIQLKEALGLPLNKKVLLYAPTWKDYAANRKVAEVSDLGIDLMALRGQIGEEYIILFKLHHLVSNQLDFSLYAGFAWNMPTHSDIQELCLISDCLITDYSSVMFDYAVLGRPMIYFITDMERYSESRGMYFNITESLPGPIVDSTDRLAASIQAIESDRGRFRNRYEKFQEKFCAWEKGNAAKRVVDEYILAEGQ
jgi:CDP-glycerol glycerophosphotransferase